jgi:hypothetical protein
MLLFILKGEENGELSFAEDLLHIPSNSLVWVTFFIGVLLFVRFLGILRIKIRFQEIIYFLVVFLLSIISLSVVGEMDKKTFWNKFPSIKIGDVKIYNEIRPKG